MSVDVKVLERLSNADGIVSCEDEVRDILRDTLAKYCDETIYDGLGSMICIQKGTGKGPKVAIAAHMDEVGFMVRSITDGGLIMLIVVGGVKTDTLAFQRLRLTTEDGKKLNGLVAGKYEKTADSQMYFDIGAKTKQDVLNLGINVGDMLSFGTEFESTNLPDTYMGKAMDDRYGCFALVEIAKAMQNIEHENDIYYIGTYGEEVGLRGAKTSAQMIKPDIYFTIDVATYPNQFRTDNTNNRQMGKGPMLTHFDRTMAPNKKLVSLVRNTATKYDLPLQYDMFNNGGTDSGEAHKVGKGIATVTTCLPCRYGHCAASIVDVNDIDNIAKLYTKILPQVTQEKIDEIYNF